jgi:hypothetical protein
MKDTVEIQVAVVYDAHVTSSNGKHEVRSYREIMTFKVPSVTEEQAPGAVRWAGSWSYQGDDHLTDVRVRDGVAYEPIVKREWDMAAAAHDRLRLLPVTLDDLSQPTELEFQSLVARIPSVPKALTKATDVKRPGPPNPASVRRSERDWEIERLTEYFQESVLFVAGTLHLKSSIPVYVIETGYDTQTRKPAVQIKLEPSGGGKIKDWFRAFSATERDLVLKEASAVARGYKLKEPAEPARVEIVDPDLAHFDALPFVLSHALAQAETALARHLPKGTIESAYLFDEVRQRRSRREDIGLQADSDLLMRVRALLTDERAERAEEFDRSVERFDALAAERTLEGLAL